MSAPHTPSFPRAPAMSSSRRLSVRRASMAAASLIVLCGTGAALADSVTPSPVSEAPATLRPLPAGPDDLVLRGEAARRSFSVALSSPEVDAIRQLQIGLSHSVVLLPEASFLKVSINGHPLDAVPLTAGSAAARVSLDVPAGLLRQGANAVDIETTMRHRVDCSIGATYELWTRLDPVRTGFVTTGTARVPVATLADLGQTSLAADGTTRIHLVSASASDAAALDRAAALIDALVIQAHLPRPIVDIGPAAGQDTGFDVILDDGIVEASSIEGRDGGLGFVRDAATGRLGVVLMGHDEAERVAALAEITGRPVSPAPARNHEVTLEGATHLALADLDVRTGDFAGRHGESAFGLTLPADFFPGDYDQARLSLDGRYAAGFDASSALALRVNGSLAATAPLSSPGGGVLRQQALNVPLSFFHPGRNEVVLESTATRPEDRDCGARPNGTEARLDLSPQSALVFPAFARLGTAPQLAAPLASPGAAALPPVPVYLGPEGQETAGAALTVLASKAAAGTPIAHPAIRFAMPTPTDAPGLVVASWTSLPVRLALAVADTMTARSADWPVPPVPVEVRSGARPRSLADAIHEVGAMPAVAEALQNIRTFGRDIRRLAPAGAVTRSAAAARLPVSAHTLLFAAAAADLPHGPASAIPGFSADARQWLLVTAPSAALVESGTARFIAEGRWPTLQGRAVSFDPDSRALASVAADHVTYLLPDHVVLSDLRPVLGGLVSDNIEAAVAVIMLLIAVLGLSTHGLVRRPGAK